jgi:hypothetical protein
MNGRQAIHKMRIRFVKQPKLSGGGKSTIAEAEPLYVGLGYQLVFGSCAAELYTSNQ